MLQNIHNFIEMKPIDQNKHKSEPVNLDEGTRNLLLIAVAIFLFCIFFFVKEDVKGKTASSSFGTFKDFQIEYVKKENLHFREFIDNFLLSDYRGSPEKMHDFSSREFEEFIAYLYMRKGFDVTLTKATKDGGKDIVAKYIMPTGETLTYFIECKRYNLENPIGVSIVRAFAGAMQNEQVHVGVIITTSRFTKDARELVRAKKYPINLKDMDDIVSLLA